MLDKVTKSGRKITWMEVKSITNIAEEYTINLALRILDDPFHPLFPEYSLLPSGLRYRMPRVKRTEHWHLLCQGVFSWLTGWIQVEGHPNTSGTLNNQSYFSDFLYYLVSQSVYHCLIVCMALCLYVIYDAKCKKNTPWGNQGLIILSMKSDRRPDRFWIWLRVVAWQNENKDTWAHIWARTKDMWFILYLC